MTATKPKTADSTGVVAAASCAPFEIGTHVRVIAGPHRGRTGEVLGRREVIAAGAAAALADDASTRMTNWIYDVRFDGAGETVSLSQTILGN